MALQLQNYTIQNGLKSELAYIVIDFIEGNEETIKLDVKAFMSKEAKDSGFQPLDRVFISFTPDVSKDSFNYHKQGYEYLKTLPKYQNAIDVFE